MKCAEYLDSGKDLDKQSMQKIADELGYKIYKFVQIYYPQDVDIETVHQIVPSDKSYTDCMCMMQVFCVPMTEEQYISFAGKMGYDTIGHKNINLNDLETDIDLSFLQEEDLEEQNSAKQALYFMQEYDFDLYSEKYLKDEIEKKRWYLTEFQWDIIKNEKVDLDKDSAEIYLAVTDNYNVDVNGYFENDFDKALYLADRNYNIETGEEFKDEDEKRLYFMKNYSYDTLAQKPIDDAVVESLFAYANYLESVFTTEERLGYNLIYIDADDIPECIVWTTNESRQLCRAFVLSYKNGSVESVTVEGDEGYYSTVGYIPRSGDFWVSSADWHWSCDDIFLLDDSFHKVNSVSYGSDCMVNGQIVDYEEYAELESAITSDEYTKIYVDMYEQNFDVIYGTLIAAYDALRTTTYKAYAPEVAEFELKDGILTLTTQDPSNGGSIDSEEVWHNVDPLFSISYPVAEDCTWEYGHDEGGFVLDEYGSFETMKEDVIADKDEIYSPFSLYIEVIDDIVVRVYSIQS